jgi:ATP-binding cassette subfamily C protein LapB
VAYAAEKPSIGSQAAFLASRALALPPSIILSSTVINMLALALPLVILQVYDRVLPNQAMGTLYVLAASLAAATIGESVLKLARGYLIDQQALAAAYTARRQAVSALLYAPWSRIARDSSSTWLGRLNAVDDATGIGKTLDQTVLLDLPYVALFMGITWLVGGVLVLVPLAVMLLFLSLTLAASRNYLHTLERRAVDEVKRYAFISEILRGITTVKLLAAEPFLLRRAEDHAELAATNSYRLIRESNWFLSMGQLFASMTMILVVTAGAYLVNIGEISLGSLACCSLLATRATQPVLRIISTWTQLQNASLTQRKADEVLGLEALPPPVTEAPGGGRVELSGIQLGAEHLPVFSGLSLTVESGEIIGITGESGSGKSALLALIAGHLSPDAGTVEINGIDIAAEDGRAQLRNVCLLGGQPAVFRGSILDNITLGRGGDAVSRAVRAVSLIGLEEQINRLPEGFGTQLGDSATDLLPRRLIQSIALARALTVDASIILIDGASGYFTHESQLLFRQAAKELAPGTTFIFTDYRAGKLQFADRVFVIENGRLTLIQGRIHELTS